MICVKSGCDNSDWLAKILYEIQVYRVIFTDATKGLQYYTWSLGYYRIKAGCKECDVLGQSDKFELQRTFRNHMVNTHFANEKVEVHKG